MLEIEDIEASYLLKLVKLQTVIKQKAKRAIQRESSLVDKTAEGLLNLILKSQRTDLLYTRLKKKLDTNSD
jgi:hypothetical protein